MDSTLLGRNEPSRVAAAALAKPLRRLAEPHRDGGDHLRGSAASTPSFGSCNSLLFGRKIERTEIEDDPIFVIGHWRSGTTLLHELLVLDPRHTFPDTYACFSPNHFLVSGWWMKPCLKILLPARRPMDNMVAGWDHPQEDEFALCNMGVPSPYLTNVFPNRPPQYQEYLDMRGVPAPTWLVGNGRFSGSSNASRCGIRSESC